METETSQTTNREHCMDWCEEKMAHMNSWFDKPIEGKLTYREIGTSEVTEDSDLNWNDLAELDHCFAREI